MNRRQFVVSAAALTASTSLGGFPLLALATESDAKAFMVEMGKRTQDALSRPGLTDDQRVAMLGEVMAKALDIDGLGKFTLGPFLRQSNADKVTEFLGLFHKYVVMFYPKLMLKLSFVAFTVRSRYPRWLNAKA